jgi:hypothetical protein
MEIMSEEISLDEYKKSYRELRVDEGRKSFSIHLLVYVLVNMMLIAVNIIKSPNDIWFIYPLIGWGIGLLAHYLSAVSWIKIGLKKNESEAEYRAKETKRKWK